MRLVWSVRALRELRAQREYIARTQPAAAARVAEHLVAATDRLTIYPNYGRQATWDVSGRLRELVVAGTPFVVLYTVADDTVIVVRVVHAAQRRGLQGVGVMNR
jgi:toxin ParE1/3/4